MIDKIDKLDLKPSQELLAPSWCCDLFCLTFPVQMLCGSCMGGKCCLACGVKGFSVTNFVEKGIWTIGN